MATNMSKTNVASVSKILKEIRIKEDIRYRNG